MEREIDRASIMPLPHPTDVARAGVPTKAVPFAATVPVLVKEKRSLPGTPGLCAPAVLPWCWCVCVLLQLSRCSLALAVCFHGCRCSSAAAYPDIEVIALFTQLLRQRIWTVPCVVHVNFPHLFAVPHLGRLLPQIYAR
jgi:hypothetical protein